MDFPFIGFSCFFAVGFTSAALTCAVLFFLRPISVSPPAWFRHGPLSSDLTGQLATYRVQVAPWLAMWELDDMSLTFPRARLPEATW